MHGHGISDFFCEKHAFSSPDLKEVLGHASD